MRCCRAASSIRRARFDEAVAAFGTELESWRDLLQYQCIDWSVGVARARFTIADLRGDLSQLDPGLAALTQATEFPQGAQSLSWGHQRYAQGFAELIKARAGRPFDAPAGMIATDDAIGAYAGREARWVVPPESRSTTLG